MFIFAISMPNEVSKESYDKSCSKGVHYKSKLPERYCVPVNLHKCHLEVYICFVL